MFASRTLKVGSVTVTGGGQYAGTPSVVFTGGGGTGAAATANMLTQTISGSVTFVTDSMSVYNSSYAGWPGYSTTSAFPTISFSGGGGSGAAAQYTTWSTNKLVRVTGLCEVSASTVSFTVSGGGGSGATIANQTSLPPRRCTCAGVYVSQGGSGYSTAPTVVFTLTTGAGTLMTEVTKPVGVANISGGVVTSVTMSNVGEYIRSNLSTSGTAGYDVSFTGGGGSGAIASQNSVGALSWWAGPDAFIIDSTIGYTITNQGSGFTSPPTVTLSNLVSGSLTAIIGRLPSVISITNGGSGYTSNPTVTISGGTLASYAPSFSPSASGTWYTYNYVNTITVTNAGTGYYSAPTISFSGGSPIVAATATANMISE